MTQYVGAVYVGSLEPVRNKPMTFVMTVKTSKDLASWAGSVLVLAALMPTWAWFVFACFLGSVGVACICQEQRLLGVACLVVALTLVVLALVVPVYAYGAVNTVGATLVCFGTFPVGLEGGGLLVNACR